MKKHYRLLMGIISTVLLSAGFSRAADKLDPLSADLPARTRAIAPTPDTVSACNFSEEQV